MTPYMYDDNNRKTLSKSTVNHQRRQTKTKKMKTKKIIQTNQELNIYDNTKFQDKKEKKHF